MNQIFKLLLTHGVKDKIMRTAISLLNTGAGVNFLHPEFLSTGWNPRIMHHDFSRLRTTTWQCLLLNGPIILHLWLDDLCTNYWSGIHLKLVVNILLDMNSLDRISSVNFVNWKKNCNLEFPNSCSSSAWASIQRVIRPNQTSRN